MSDVDISVAINRQLAALATWRAETIDAALAILQPGWRLCLHAERRDPFDPQVDTFTYSVRLKYHYLATEQQCEEPDRTEYGPA